MTSTTLVEPLAPLNSHGAHLHACNHWDHGDAATWVYSSFPSWCWVSGDGDGSALRTSTHIHNVVFTVGVLVALGYDTHLDRPLAGLANPAREMRSRVGLGPVATVGQNQKTSCRDLQSRQTFSNTLCRNTIISWRPSFSC